MLCRIEKRAATLEPAGPSLSAARRSVNNLGPLEHGAPDRGSAMSDTPKLLLAHHLMGLKLPTFLREYDKQARQCAAEGVDHVRYVVPQAELELIDRERRMVPLRIRMAKFPAVKSLDRWRLQSHAIAQQDDRSGTGAFCVHRAVVQTIIALGNSGTGKTQIFSASSQWRLVRKASPSAGSRRRLRSTRLIDARDEKRLVQVPEAVSKIQAADHR